MELALGMALKFCNSVIKRLKLKKQNVLGGNSYVCLTYREKTVTGFFCPSLILNTVNFFTSYNPALANINKIVQNSLSVLHTDEDMKKPFPPNSHTTIYRREKNLKEMLSPSVLPLKFKENES